jgi:CzcA family heavy metal efflux pump
MDLRTLSDYTIRRRLMSIKGVSQVIPIGGERMQYQVLVSSEKLQKYGVSIDDLEIALQQTNLNTTGGFISKQGNELLIRSIGRVQNISDIESTVVKDNGGNSVLLHQVATVKLGAAIKRGDGAFKGKEAVILSIEKQPTASTVQLTDEILKAFEEIKTSLPKDVKVQTDVFQQKTFIQNALTNVEHALRDGFILIVIILFLFLLNFRTTVITLTAIPLSLVITAIIFKIFGISINTLTLGGLAIAIGELVDDAIVDVENVFRRIKENKISQYPKPLLQVVYSASSEVRNSIVYATIIVVLVFIPLFYLQGIEGKIFIPLGIAYITSIIASLLVSLTITPVLCSYLLGKKSRLEKEDKESPLVRFLKRQDIKILNFGFRKSKLVIASAIVLIISSISIIPFFGTEFLPAFNEGSFTVNILGPAGMALEESNKIGSIAEKQILKVPDVLLTARRTGRAELDEHAEPPSYTEIDVALKEEKREKDVILADIREKLSVVKGVDINIGQPISHRLDHLLSGVRAQIAIKVFGNDLNDLRSYAVQINNQLKSISGVVDIQTERQVLVPQLKIKIKREALQRFGLQAGKVAEILEVYYNGKVTGQVYDGQKSFDIILRTDNESRSDFDKIKSTQIALPNGSMIPISQLADIEVENNFNAISHENTQRRIVISCNVQGRDLGNTVKEIQSTLAKNVPLKEGYYLQYGGQFESQQSASKLILILSIFSVLGVFLVLYSHFKSSVISLQIMLNIPLALVGSVIAVWLSGGVFSIATMVGFITLTGIASRNGIMMISHYIHLVQHEGESFNKEMIIRGSLERLIPVLMTALVAALALIPLTLDANAPGKEILYPVAIVILGGLISCTLLDIIVTPVVFYKYGKKSLEQYIEQQKKKNEIQL